MAAKFVTTDDRVALYVEETGEGPPVLFLHEFAGDWRSWEPQVRHLSRQYRCVTFNARGYPPSDVPAEDAKYSQERARLDAIAVMDALDVRQAHVVGHSMGAYTALHMGIRNPGRVRSIVAAGCGWGSDPGKRDDSVRLAQEIARMFRDDGIDAAARAYADFPMRWPHRAKDPRGWAEFARFLAEHSAEGSALTMLNVQMKRPTLWDMAGDLKRLDAPVLVIVGDEDEPCLDGSVMMKRTIPGCALYVVPRAGHTINSEEPAAFNAALMELFAAVDAGRWLAHKAR
jgi:pimeloyl-ACP methyl ester carboxylesterase